MKNSQVAVLCAVILLAAVIVAGGNFLLVRSIERDLDERYSSGDSLPTRLAESNRRPAARSPWP